MPPFNCLIEGREERTDYRPKWDICQEEVRAMTSWCLRPPQEQPSISSFRKTAQRKTEGGPLPLLPGKAQRLLRRSHTYPRMEELPSSLPAVML